MVLPSRQPCRRLPGVRRCPAPAISPRGAGRPWAWAKVQWEEDAEAAESLPPSLSLSLSLSVSRCGLITALAAWAPNILPPPEDSSRNGPAPAGTGRPARLPRAAPRLFRFSARGEFVERLGLKGLPWLPHLRQVAKVFAFLLLHPQRLTQGPDLPPDALL